MIQVEQTLHGYERGHKLLASSVKLSEKGQHEMLVLSAATTRAAGWTRGFVHILADIH